MIQPLHIRGAHIWDENQTVQRDLYTTDVVTEKPANNALVVDLDGYTIFPGLINAHDHLELNHFPRSKFRERYDNAHQWGEDMNARLDTEPYKSLRAYPLWDKLFIGGLKNLLCGATTVVHHNPPHKDLWRDGFPVRVIWKYRWAHSFHFNTPAEILSSYEKTPKNVPWFIHLAEGTDEIAHQEGDKFNKLLCCGYNIMLIHCVGILPHDIDIIGPGVGGMIWCPSTNFYLLGKTVDFNHWVIWTTVAIGSDSRLTADGDLLDELHSAYVYYVDTLHKGDFQLGRKSAQYIVQMATSDAQHILLSDKVGNLKASAYADFIAIHSSENDTETLCNSRRADLALVVKGGVPQIGDPDVMAKFPHVQTIGATLDGKPKRIQLDLARRIHDNKLKEHGLEVDALPKRKFMLW